MKQMRVILKAQGIYFHPHISAVHKYEDDMTSNGQQYDTQRRGTKAMVYTLLSVVRHIIFVSTDCWGMEMKVDLLSFQNHPCLLNLVRIETLEKQMCVHGALWL